MKREGDFPSGYLGRGKGKKGRQRNGGRRLDGGYRGQGLGILGATLGARLYSAFGDYSHCI